MDHLWNLISTNLDRMNIPDVFVRCTRCVYVKSSIIDSGLRKIKNHRIYFNYILMPHVGVILQQIVVTFLFTEIRLKSFTNNSRKHCFSLQSKRLLV